MEENDPSITVQDYIDIPDQLKSGEFNLNRFLGEIDEKSLWILAKSCSKISKTIDKIPKDCLKKKNPEENLQYIKDNFQLMDFESQLDCVRKYGPSMKSDVFEWKCVRNLMLDAGANMVSKTAVNELILYMECEAKKLIQKLIKQEFPFENTKLKNDLIDKDQALKVIKDKEVKSESILSHKVLISNKVDELPSFHYEIKDRNEKFVKKGHDIIMAHTIENDLKLAILIDADNISADAIEVLLAEVSKFGVPVVKRIYGDWTRPNLNSWKKVVNTFAISPKQQFNYTTGKNSTDSAMIIDAMDLLHTQKYDAFCIVSSDSDFTRLAIRIREEGKSVYGFGNEHTPQAFIAACNKFIYLEVLQAEQEKTTEQQQPKSDKKIKNLQKLIVNAITQTADESGWAWLSKVGEFLLKQNPEFDSRNFGYRKLSDLVEDLKIVDVKKVSAANNPSSTYYVKIR